MVPIKVLVVDDDLAWREGISDLLQPESDIVVVDTAKNKEEAIAKAKALEIDVVLLDIVMSAGRFDGIEAAHEISALDKCKIMMFSALDRKECILDSFSCSIDNYVTKEHYNELPQLIREVYRNRSPIHRSVAPTIKAEFIRMRQAEITNVLTKTEKEILKLVAQNLKHNDISKKLRIEKRTLKNHINRILKKIKVSSSKEAAQVAQRKGML